MQRKISLLFSDPEDFREELETGKNKGEFKLSCLIKVKTVYRLSTFVSLLEFGSLGC